MNAVMSGIRLVSWDVDGTLFSYWRLARPLARELSRAAATDGWPTVAGRITEAWRFHRTVERQRRQLNSAVNHAALEPFESAVAWERDVLLAALQTAPLRVGALKLMDQFAASGVTQVALSDFECAAKTRRLGVAILFARTYSCERMGFWKPSPVPLARIQQDFGVAPSEHLHIGDRQDTDGAACAANGCRFMPIDRLPRAWNVFNAICAASALDKEVL
jgi:FMN phosphatase YigB (HAD superfamily)